MFSLLLGLALCALFLWMRHRDRRRLSNGFVMVAAAFFLIGGVGELLARWWPWTSYVWLVVVLLMPFAIMVLGVYLIRNGLTMWRREGRSPGNLLSLAAGILVFALPVIALALVYGRTPAGLGIAVLLFFLSSYVGATFVVFLSYAFAYARMPARFEPDALVVLGSRIIDGRVPPLLRARLDKAVELYHHTEPKPLVIPSGGQGPDESRPEGEVMAEYLIEAGVPAGDVRAENAARTTEQNLRLGRDVQLESGRTGPLVAVTNDYHVLRSALLSRKLDLDAEVVGARTASYYRPSAFLREYVAVIMEHKVLNALACLPFVMLSVGLFLLLQQHG